MVSPPIQRALISVADKQGLAEFARGLVAHGVRIYSTGGTRRHLEASGLTVVDVASYTGFPEMLDGSVKTLHPMVHGGILARHDRPDDLRTLATHGIVTFELVVVNLYPFEQTIRQAETSLADAVKQMDIGGSAMLRAAAKNHAFITVASEPGQYPAILEQIAAKGCTTPELRARLAQAAFARTARYDQAIAGYLASADGAEAAQFPDTWHVDLHRREMLRYGENPHQAAALYALSDAGGANLVTAVQLSGKELSYNNLLDLDSALALVRSLDGPAAVVIKHNNPCGASTAATLATAARQALDGDPLSAFGSVLGFNQIVDAETAEVLAEPDRFIEAIIAPDYEPQALDILTKKPKWKATVRLMKVGSLEPPPSGWHLRQIEGGMLLQESDAAPADQTQWHTVTAAKPTSQQLDDLHFAWTVVRHVKSNAIVVARNRMLLGVGAGQMSRVDAVEIGLRKAGDRAAGAVLASDAFFPFADSIERAAEAAIAAIIQPGGSRRDDEVVAACNQHGLPMIFTGRRHFKH